MKRRPPRSGAWQVGIGSLLLGALTAHAQTPAVSIVGSGCANVSTFESSHAEARRETLRMLERVRIAQTYRSPQMGTLQENLARSREREESALARLQQVRACHQGAVQAASRPSHQGAVSPPLGNDPVIPAAGIAPTSEAAATPVPSLSAIVGPLLGGASPPTPVAPSSSLLGP